MDVFTFDCFLFYYGFRLELRVILWVHRILMLLSSVLVTIGTYYLDPVYRHSRNIRPNYRREEQKNFESCVRGVKVHLRRDPVNDQSKIDSEWNGLRFKVSVLSMD